jgi:hypothetical protein
VNIANAQLNVTNVYQKLCLYLSQAVLPLHTIREVWHVTLYNAPARALAQQTSGQGGVVLVFVGVLLMVLAVLMGWPLPWFLLLMDDDAKRRMRS